MRSCFRRGTTVKATLTRKRKYLLWPVVFGALFASAGQMRKLTTNDTGGKGVARSRWRTDNLDTGDMGHSATGTSIRIEAQP